MSASNIKQYVGIATILPAGETRKFYCECCKSAEQEVYRSDRSNDVVRHIRCKHMRLPAVVCELCGQGFAQKSYLKDHMNTHNKRKPHECSTCGKGYADSSALNRHEKTKHGKIPTLKRARRARQTIPATLTPPLGTQELPIMIDDDGNFPVVPSLPPTPPLTPPNNSDLELAAMYAECMAMEWTEPLGFSGLPADWITPPVSQEPSPEGMPPPSLEELLALPLQDFDISPMQSIQADQSCEEVVMSGMQDEMPPVSSLEEVLVVEHSEFDELFDGEVTDDQDEGSVEEVGERLDEVVEDLDREMSQGEVDEWVAKQMEDAMNGGWDDD